AAPSPPRAHIASFAVRLDATQEIPPPNGASGATGTGTLVLEDNGTVETMVDLQGLTGPAVAAHIHEGAAGVANPIPLVDFTATIVSANTIRGTGGRARSEERRVGK